MMEQERAVPDDPVRRFLHLCLRGRWDGTALEAARDVAARGDLDWDAFLDTAHTEGLAPLLYSAVRDGGIVPQPVEEDLRSCYYTNAVRNGRLFDELRDALRCLAAEGISVILLKGAALNAAVYDDAALRTMSDLDLMVRREDAPQALDALASLHYEPMTVELRPGFALDYQHAISLRKTSDEVTFLDLHWSLLGSTYYLHHLPMDWFWKTAQPVRVGDASAFTLGPEAQVLHLCSNLLLHQGGKEMLGQHDIAAVILHHRGRLDWDTLLSRAHAYDLVLPLQRVLPQVASAWGAPVPGDVLARLQTLRPSPGERRRFALLTAERQPLTRRFWADLTSMSLGKRLYFAWINLLPSPAYMRHRYGIRHPLLLPLYYPYRWLTNLFKPQ